MQKVLSFVAMLLVRGAMCFAQSSSDKQTSASASSANKTFMMKAAQGGQAEVTIGQLAQQKGSSDTVKQLGQTLVNDHQTANQQLQQIAQEECASSFLKACTISVRLPLWKENLYSKLSPP